MEKDPNEMSTGELISSTFLKGYDEISGKIRNNAIPKAKKGIIGFLFFIIILFIGFWLILAVGIKLEDKFLTILGRLGVIFSSLILLILATPIGFIFAGRRYTTFVRSCAIYQLFVVLLIWISPMPITFFLLFGLTLAGCVLAMINAAADELILVKVVTLIIFILSMIYVFVPSLKSNLDRNIGVLNEPTLLKIRHGDIPQGKIRFFVRGKPAVWYFINNKGEYELFDNEGYHDIYRVKIIPIDLKTVDALVENENLISARNFIDRSPENKIAGNMPDQNPPGENFSPSPNPPSPPTPHDPPLIITQTQPTKLPDAIPHIPTPPPVAAKPEKTQTPVPEPVKPETAPPVQPVPQPKPKKAYAYCIKSNIHAGELERQVSRQIAATIGEKILDASGMDIKTFTQQAEKIIVVDKVNFNRSDNADEITCTTSIEMRIVNLRNGDTINRVATAQTQKAFDWETARRLALETAIKSATIRLKKVM